MTTPVLTGPSALRIGLAEIVGTFVLVLGGPGTAILAGFVPETSVGVLGVSLAFGLSLLAMAYAIGSISGCHINPAVTVGLWLNGNVPGALVPVYVVAQLVGAALAALTIAGIASDGPNGFDPSPLNFAVNGWDALSPGGFGFGAMVAVEITFTAILVFVVLSTTARRFPPGATGLTAGLTLTLIHLVTIPVDNTSVNPARSFGTAIVAGGDALDQLWAFLVLPIVGAVIAAVVWRVLADRPVDQAA
jgi:aquaporin Z